METVAEIINSKLDEFSPTERKIARTLLADYPSAGLGTTATLAAASGASAPTVVRFSSHLGFESFIDLQDTLRSELTARAKSPARRAEEEMAADRPSDSFSLGGQLRADLIRETFRRVPRSEARRLIKALATSRNHVYVSGGHFSGMVARIASLQLSKVRPGVHFLDDVTGRGLPAVNDLRKRDVLLLFDVRRYEPSLPDIAELARQNGATIALITDQWLSPVASHADIVLQAAVDVSFYDSLAGCLALAETIIHETASEIDGALDRMKRIEDMRNHILLDGREQGRPGR